MAHTIAIAGCGPAGLAAALFLHRDGHRVTLFERFDSPQPVGSGLMIQPTGLAVLRELGLAEAVIASGARIDRLFGATGTGNHTVLDVRYKHIGTGHGIGIHRATLFGLLHAAVVAEGIAIETGTAITGATQLPIGRSLYVGPKAVPFDLVVDAMGSSSVLAKRSGKNLSYGALWTNVDWPDGAGFDDTALEQRYHRASTMAGVLPIGCLPGESVPKASFFWSLHIDRLPSWRKRGLDAWKAQVVALWPQTRVLLDQIDDPEQLVFARYAHRTLADPAVHGMIHIGDAWHSTSPQLGQGANMALLDAYALRLGLRAHPQVNDAVEHAVRLRRSHIGLYQLISALFTPVYQSDSRLLPLLRDWLVGPLSTMWPATKIQAAMVSGLVGDPLGPLGLR